MQVAAHAALRGIDPTVYLTAEGDDEVILRAVVQRAINEYGEQRTAEIEALGKTVAHEVAKILS